MSDAAISSNSIAERISSDSCSSRPPPSCVGFFDFEDLDQRFFPGREHKGQRREDQHEKSKDRIGKEGKTFGALFGQNFGGHFAEDQRHARHDSGRRDRCHVAVCDQPQKENGRQRRHRDIDDVVADENGRQQFVVGIEQLDRLAGALIAGRLHALEPNAADTGVGRLGSREKARQNEQYDQYKDQNPLTWVHKLLLKNAGKYRASAFFKLGIEKPNS